MASHMVPALVTYQHIHDARFRHDFSSCQLARCLNLIAQSPKAFETNVSRMEVDPGIDQGMSACREITWQWRNGIRRTKRRSRHSRKVRS